MADDDASDASDASDAGDVSANKSSKITQLNQIISSSQQANKHDRTMAINFYSITNDTR